MDSLTGKAVNSPSPGDRLEEDYLLVTVLPRFADGPQRLVWFSGIHRPAQASLQSILTQPPMAELEKLRRKIGVSQYYQALFHVGVTATTPSRRAFDLGPDVPRELHPTRATFVDAWRLDDKIRME
jgi:hypothetical protein